MSTPSPSPTSTPSSSPPPSPSPNNSETPTPDGSDSPSPSNSSSPSPSESGSPSPSSPSGSESPKHTPSGSRGPSGKPPAPDADGGFNVKPSHLYWLSEEIARIQTTFDKAGITFAKDIDKGGAAGRGAASSDFAKAYDALAKDCLALWARSVVSVGGASTGFTVTANNYRAADHASDPKAKGSPPRRDPPTVIEKPPHYDTPASLLFADSDGDDTELRDVLDEISGVTAEVIEALLEKVKGLTRLSDVWPWADAGELDEIAAAWRTASTSAKGVGTNCGDAVSWITDGTNNEWQKAMKQFTGSLWGTTSWGKNQGGYEYGHGHGNKPILDVLKDVSSTVAEACENVAKAARKLKREVRHEVWKAAKATAKELLDFDVKEKIELALGPVAKVTAIFLSKLDQKALADAVDAYEKVLRAEPHKFTKHQADIEEATKSAPTFKAESGRAQAFGTRSLWEFKKTHALPEDDGKKHKYPIDLAGEEWIDGTHSVDRHVGKTDEQLNQRLRDQNDARSRGIWPHGKPIPSAASTFSDMERAKQLTQHCIDSKSSEIEAWLNQPPRAGAAESFESSTPDKKPSGRSVSREDWRDAQNAGQPTAEASAKPVDRVRTVLRYDPSLDPPFVVLTSMPVP
ncbi:RNase A-like domain-containing protein [Streptomyces qinglanensis]|uniref:RNase A-like domain-containing protein n=1 Tax=Streptomyces qinglanensis TaxID=943816 RepID=UPI003D762897